MRKLIDKISAWLVGFGIEAYLHIVCVMVVALLVARVCYWTGADRSLAAYIGALVAFLVGFFKESYDNRTEGVFEARDIAANAIGAALFWAIFV